MMSSEQKIYSNYYAVWQLRLILGLATQALQFRNLGLVIASKTRADLGKFDMAEGLHANWVRGV